MTTGPPKFQALNLGCRQVEGHGGVLEVAFVGAVAERLLVGEAAAADADALAAAQAVGLALGVHDFEILALHAEGAIGENGEFGGHVFELWVMGYGLWVRSYEFEMVSYEQI